jgi:RNA polymerase sigma factor (sigma-70 family)
MNAASRGTVLKHVRRLIAAGGAEGQTDGELLRAFAERHDQAVFAVLVRRHGPMVFNLCRRVLRHQQDAEDVFQATFLVLARHATAVRNGQALAAWLHQAAYRLALGLRRAGARRRHHEGKAAAMTPQDPSTDVAFRELQVLLEDEVQRLPEKCRMAFVLCCLEGQSRAEAARLLGVKEGTISSRIDQARKRLQGRLTRRGVTLAAVLTAAAVADTARAAGALTRLCYLTARAAAGGAVGPHVVALVGQGTPLLFAARSKVVPLLLAAWLVAGAAGLIACQSAAEGSRAEEPAGERQPSRDQARRTDAHGDALPDEALARLGTLRFRPGGFMSSLAFAPDAKSLVALDTQGGVCVLDASDGRALRRFSTGTTRQRPALSANGRWAAVLTGKGNLPIDPEVSLELWDCSRGTRGRAFGKAPFATAAFSPDGKVLAGLRYDEIVELWDPHAGRLIHSWKAGDGPGLRPALQGAVHGRRQNARHQPQEPGGPLLGRRHGTPAARSPRPSGQRPLRPLVPGSPGGRWAGARAPGTRAGSEQQQTWRGPRSPDRPEDRQGPVSRGRPARDGPAEPADVVQPRRILA